MDWRLERSAEVVDHHVHLLVHWGERTRHLFVANALVEELAGRSLSRSDAAAYVDANVSHLVEAARRRWTDGGSDPTTIALESRADLA